jgi:N-acetylmuramic acid 6-phosphate etherase
VTEPTEQRDPAGADIDLLPTRRLVELVNDQDATVAPLVRAAAEPIAAAVDLIAGRLRDGGRLVYAGAGTAGRLGVLDASECGPTFGTDRVLAIVAGGPAALTAAVEGAEDDAAAAVAALADLTAADVVVGISASGSTPFVLGALRHARATGAARVAVASNPGSPAAALADVAIEVVTGPEFIAGSTRMKAGTAQKLVLNTLSTLVMVRLGKTYGNLMVDLRAGNAKLAARAERIVVLATGCADAEARAALRQAGGEVKPAILALLTGAPAAEARRALDAAGGNLRAALSRRAG